MYTFYLDELLLPVSPEKVVTKIVNKNQTISLINDEEINLLKNNGLTEIEFDFLLPSEKYPFATYRNKQFLKPNYFIDKLKESKNNKQSIKLTIIRDKGFNNNLFNLNMRVSIEEMVIHEQHDNGFDIMVSITLKQYNVVKTKTGSIGADGKITVKEERPFFENETKTNHIMKNGDSLFDVCHMILGDGDLCTEIAKKNGFNSPLDVVGGTLIRFDL